MLWHPPHVFPILLLQSVLVEKLLLLSLDYHLWEAHHVEDSVQLVMVVRVAGLYILLPYNFNNSERVQRNKTYQTSHLQWKIGSLVRSSANMQPMAQMSIA